MTYHMDPQSMQLQNNDCVAIVGGGPAGSFFARYLLRESKRLNLHLDVVIIEKRKVTKNSNGNYHILGCPSGAGGISPRLNKILQQQGYTVPEEIIQGHIDYIWVHGRWKNLRLRVPDDMQMYSVFRGSLPAGRGTESWGLDGFLLGEAVKEGARILNGEVQSIAYSENGMPTLTVRLPSRERRNFSASFVVVATGINTRRGNGLLASIRQLNPAFVPGESRKAFIFELDVGEDYLKHNMDREIHFIEYGSKHLALEHAALLPKGKYLSVTLIGKSIDEAIFPQDSQRIIRGFLKLSHINHILPDVETISVACICFPRMASTPAKYPFGDRFAMVGDALGARLNKDGLFSAHVTASGLAQTIIHEGIDKQSLAKGYRKTIKWLKVDNRFGRIVFKVIRVAFGSPAISRVVYQSFATEFKIRDEHSRPVGSVLWKIASGTADYHQVLRTMFSFRVLQSIFVGAVITLRNVAFELLFGLKWGRPGRYPTVVLKELRQAIKQFLESRLGMALDESPDFERMYIIKIQGSQKEIMEELAKFGQPNARFLNLRFVTVRQIRGMPNQVGSTIQYKIPFIELGTELCLTKRVGSGTLLYQLDEQLSKRGKFVLDVAPTKDGNNKLTIYAAFDYKQGKTFVGRILWGFFSMLFPEFVHDVVWNHALCTIKEDVEARMA
ncbi:MAG: hypothetical protein MAG431_01822 [Chloroflexi bacterium]|nr:hypothetical protein [Chloroflexota bacterium]